MGTLVLVRHGESQWNLANKFTGWADVPLTAEGIKEAQQLALHCQHYHYAAAFTSSLIRAQMTLGIVLAKQATVGVFQHPSDGAHEAWIQASNIIKDGEIPIWISSNLNERYYGDLQGMEKSQAAQKYGEEQLMAWRRGYTEAPPNGESLAHAHDRMHNYFVKNILSRVIEGQTILLVAHGNTLRAAIKHLEHISDEQISYVDLPKAKPLVYKHSGSDFERIEGSYDFNRPLR